MNIASRQYADAPARPPAGPGRLNPARLRTDRNPAAVYLAGLAPGSRPAQRAALATIAREPFPVPIEERRQVGIALHGRLQGSGHLRRRARG